MATKSDFAQKLLSDLRLRKERMSAAPNSTGRPGQNSRDMHGNPGGMCRGTQQINALESAASRIGNSARRSKAGSKSMHFEESSNQIVLYGQGQRSAQVRDLSMAIAFAFENSGKLSKITASSSNPLVNFFNRFSRRSMGSQKVDISSFDHGCQLATVTHINTAEISRGVQNLNEILRGYSNGMNFDKDSIKIGKELLKGAIDLEESLRMLVNLQEASEYMNGSQQKSRLRLLDEEEDDQEDIGKTAGKWQLDRPRFSFDKASRSFCSVQGEAKNNTQAISYLDETTNQTGNSSKTVPHKRSASCVQDLNFAMQPKPNGLGGSLHERGRISNVVAKLMGLEEIPRKEDSRARQKDSGGNEEKQVKTASKSSKLSEPLNRNSMNNPRSRTDKKSIPTNNSPQTRDTKQGLKVRNGHGTTEGKSKMVDSDTNRNLEDSKILAVGTEAGPGPSVAIPLAHKQQSHAIAANQMKGPQTSEEIDRKRNVSQDAERKPTETKQITVFNSEDSKAKYTKKLKTEDIAYDRIKSKVNADHLEKRNAKDLQSNQQIVLIQVPATKKSALSENRDRAEPRNRLPQKHLSQPKKQEYYQTESTVSPKAKKFSMEKLEKKLSCDTSKSGNGKITEPVEKIPMQVSENSKLHLDIPAAENFEKNVVNQGNLKREEQSQISFPRELKFPKGNGRSSKVIMQEKQIDGSVTQTKATSRKVEKSENPRKIDAMLSRKNPNAYRSARSVKQSANIMQDLKQQLHHKDRSSKRTEQQIDSKAKEGEGGGKIMISGSEMICETLNQSEKLHFQAVAAEQIVPLNSSQVDECATKNIADISILDESSDAISRPGKIADEQQERPSGFEGGELTQHDKTTEGREKSSETTLSRQECIKFSASGKQEPLTEAEKGLKEIIIKSQLFLNTAEALFKLNIPASFLHAGDHNDEIADKKLMVDCGCEIMRRKARRHEITFHPYTNPAAHCEKVSSLDDLVKQLHRDFETLKFYGGNGSDDCDVAESIYKMLNRDIHNSEPDVNIMWDSQWKGMMFMSAEKEDVIKDVEKHMLNGLLDEITNDLSLVTVYV